MSRFRASIVLKILFFDMWCLGVEYVEDDDLSVLFDFFECVWEFFEYFLSVLILMYADAERASLSRTFSRTSTSAYDDILIVMVLL